MKNTLTKNIESLINNIKKNQLQHPIKLVAATKYFSTKETQEILNNPSIDYIGENKIQDAIKKQKEINSPIGKWHFIGHLQKNKVKLAIKHFSCIQSIDSIKLLERLNTECEKQNKTINGLIQVNTGKDINKHGFLPEEALNNIPLFYSFPHIKIQGIMMIAPQLDNKKELKKIMQETKKIQLEFQKTNSNCTILSMGMSQDYKLAIEEGSTMIRIGRSLLK